MKGVAVSSVKEFLLILVVVHPYDFFPTSLHFSVNGRALFLALSVYYFETFFFFLYTITLCKPH